MKSSNNFVIVNQPTQTAKYLTPLIFNKEALSSLAAFGLVNVYFDDYGQHNKYNNCLFFLFAVNHDAEYDRLEKTLANFKSFYDYYDVLENGMELRMFVFRVHDVYLQDLFSFKSERFDELSPRFYSISEAGVGPEDFKFNFQDEIYRFNLKIVKEEL